MAKLAEARRTAGLTMEQLSDLSGVDIGVISRAERCLRIPSLASLLDLAKALHLDLPETLAGVLPPASSKPVEIASNSPDR